MTRLPEIVRAGSLASHLATQHGIYNAHLMADEEEGAEEACTTVPAKPTTWTGSHLAGAIKSVSRFDGASRS